MGNRKKTSKGVAGTLRRVVGDESGYAMPIVVGMMLLLTMMGMFMLTEVDNAMNSARRVEQDGIAFQIAAAGLDRALVDMQYNTYVPGHFPMTGTMDGGTYRVAASDLGNTEFKVVSVGTASDGTTSTISEKFFYLNMWAMNIAAGSKESLVSGSSGLHGSTSVYGPLYIRGSLEMPSNSFIGKGPLFIRDGSLSLTGSGSIGTAGEMVNAYVTGAHPAAGSKGWFVDRVSSSVPVVTLPVLNAGDMLSRQDKARAESVDNIQGTAAKSGSSNHEAVSGDPATYSTISPPNSGTWTRSKAPGSSDCYKDIDGSLTIQPGTSFGSWYGDGHTATIGEHDDFAYDGAGKLYVEGTVYVDGDLNIVGDTYYTGNGSIVVNGDINISGKFMPVGGNLMASSAVGLVSNGDINLSCGGGNVVRPDDSTPADISGAFFCNGTLNLNNHFVLRGTTIAGGISFNANNAHLMTNPLLPTFLPDSLPGNGFSILTSSSWGRQ